MLCTLLLQLPSCARVGPAEGPLLSVAVFADTLADARHADASTEQLATLEEAVTTSSISLEAAREAARRAVSCMQEAGLDARFVEQTLAHGVVLPGYEVVPPPGEDVDAEVTACDEHEFFFVSRAYQLQPTSVEATERFVEQVAPAIRACLERNGYDTDDDARGSDLAQRASEVLHETEGGVDCLGEAGVQAW